MHCSKRFLPLLLFVLMPAAFGQLYTAKLLQTPQGYAINPRAINDSNQVAGTYQPVPDFITQPCIWSPDKFVDLPIPSEFVSGADPIGINNTGTVIGNGAILIPNYADVNRSVIWLNGSPQIIAPDAPTLNWYGGTYALGVNDSNTVLMSGVAGQGADKPLFLWNGGDPMFLSGTPDYEAFDAYRINNNGWYVGLRASNYQYFPTLWTSSSAFVDLTAGIYPKWINNGGLVTGAASPEHAFILDCSTGTPGQLTILPDDNGQSSGRFINDKGTVVGWRSSAGTLIDSTWVIWKDQQMTVLNSPAGIADFQSGDLSPIAINNKDTIIAVGTLNGVFGGYLLEPNRNVQIRLDGNRDGVVTNTTDDDSPITHAYRFWVNEDDDSDNGVVTLPPTTSPNSASEVIVSKDDLQNFSKMGLFVTGLVDTIAKGETKVGLKWKNPFGDPAIRVFLAYDQSGSFSHLSNDAVATNQATLDGCAAELTDEIKGTDTFWLPDNLWTGLTAANPVKYLLFEGTGIGGGQLTVVIKGPDGVETESSSASLLLKSIMDMYQRNDGSSFTPPPDEQPTAIVFVHGWNQSPERSESFAETMYKRLWQLGYKGRFASFRWDTGWSDIGIEKLDAYLANYNASEFTAWHTGADLKAFIESLPQGYERDIAAHSMGNIVVGSALKAGLGINNYALLNGAVPACCYDDSQKLKQTRQTRTYTLFGEIEIFGFKTPDEEQIKNNPITRNLAYRGQLNGVTGNLINFFLPTDEATVNAWEFNNAVMKPAILFSGYYFYNPHLKDGQKLGFTFTTDPLPNSIIHYLADPYEAMPLADQSWSRAIGAEKDANGAIKNKIDMTQFGFNSEHSAEWTRSIQQTMPFYGTLLTQFNLHHN